MADRQEQIALLHDSPSSTTILRMIAFAHTTCHETQLAVTMTVHHTRVTHSDSTIRHSWLSSIQFCTTQPEVRASDPPRNTVGCYYGFSSITERARLIWSSIATRLAVHMLHVGLAQPAAFSLQHHTRAAVLHLAVHYTCASRSTLQALRHASERHHRTYRVLSSNKHKETNATSGSSHTDHSSRPLRSYQTRPVNGSDRSTGSNGE